MNRTEHLLTILAEECCAVAQRATTALRFGLNEIQPGQNMANAERIKLEYVDLLSVVGMLTDEGFLPPIGTSYPAFSETITAKKAKIEKFLRYSAELGTLQS